MPDTLAFKTNKVHYQACSELWTGQPDAFILAVFNIEPNHAASVKLIFLILTIASAGILFYYVTAALKMSKRKPYG